MKKIFLKTKNRFTALPNFKFIDRDKSQLEAYGDRPPVRFPCALISISYPKRKNLATGSQMLNCNIKIRLGFERTTESSNISNQQRTAYALSYYDNLEAVEALFQGYEDDEMNAWECTSTQEDPRPDLDVVTLTFSTSFIKQF